MLRIPILISANYLFFEFSDVGQIRDFGHLIYYRKTSNNTKNPKSLLDRHYPMNLKMLELIVLNMLEKGKCRIVLTVDVDNFEKSFQKLCFFCFENGGGRTMWFKDLKTGSKILESQ